MAARATWKGVLKIGLVTIPIKVYPATESTDGLAFHQLHSVCQTRIHQRKWCVPCGKEVPAAELVKGFEFEKGRYVLLSEDEVAHAKPESTRVIDLLQFCDAAALDPIYLDRAYYLAPDGGFAADAYVVMREAMCGRIGIGKLALYGRECLVAVRPSLWTLMLYTLHHAAEIRPLADIEDLGAVAHTVKGAEVALARRVIARFARPLNLVHYTDEVRVSLQRIIDAKIAGREIVEAPVAAAPLVVPLLDALRQSLRLEAVRPKKKKTSMNVATPRKLRAKAS